MRTLTIKRHTSGIERRSRLKVYIECREGYETIIAGIPCKKLGTLRSGEEASFPVSEDSQKVFVVADGISKNLSNDFYQLPAGGEDIYLSGKPRFNILSGNAFRFDGEATDDMKKNRRRGQLKLGILFASLLLAAILVGVIMNIYEKKNSTEFRHELYTITLPNEFEEVEMDDCIACYSDGAAAIVVYYEPVENFEPSESFAYDTLAEFLGDTEHGEIVKRKNVAYCTYEKSPGGIFTLYYLTAIVTVDDGFLVFDFGTEASSEEYYSKTFEKCVKTIKTN